MKIFLDDERPTPHGWSGCRWPSEVINMLLQHGDSIEEISLDHDLGDKEASTLEGRKEITGYDVIEWIEEQVFTINYRPPTIHIHSSNGPGVSKMKAGVAQIKKLSNKNL